MNRKARFIQSMLGLALSAGLASTIRAQEENPGAEAPVVESVLEVTVEGEEVSIHAQEVTVQEVMDRLRQDFPIELDIPDEILSQKISLELKKVPMETVIETIAGSNALVYERVGDGYKLVSARLTTQQDYVPPVLTDLSRKEKRNVDAKRKQAEQILSDFGAIFGDAGELNYDQAKALIQERNAKVQAIVDQLAALGPGGARAMEELYGGGGAVTREQLAMIEALGKIDDEEASKVLGALYGDEDRYSLLRAIIGALGGRADAESVLAAILAGTSDMRLRGGAVQAIGGRPEALDVLTGIVNTETETLDVRQESIRSIGRIGSDAARSALVTVASTSANLALRKAAIQELGRSFGEAAVPELDVLLKDPSEAVRQSAVHALGRVGSSSALDLIRTASTSDVSALVRAHAESALSNQAAAGTPAPPPSPN